MPELAWPWVFLFLPLPWICWRFLPAAAPARTLRLPLDDAFLDSASGRVSRTHVAWLALAWLLLLVAAARPQWVGAPQPVMHSGRSMMLSVDISGSMAIRDMRLDGRPVSRFEAVESIVGDFIGRRQGDRLGLVLFGSHAYLVTPVTYDLDAVQAQLRGAVVGLAGRQTAIGDAVAVAVKRLRKLPAKSRVLVLLTDGVNNAGSMSPQQAAKVAAAAGVRVYVIGMGSDQAQMSDWFGLMSPSPSAELDEGMLKRIAASTGGAYFRAADSGQLAAAYHRIDELEPLQHEGKPLRPRRELFMWPLLAAWLVVLAACAWRRHRQGGGEKPA